MALGCYLIVTKYAMLYFTNSVYKVKSIILYEVYHINYFLLKESYCFAIKISKNTQPKDVHIKGVFLSNHVEMKTLLEKRDLAGPKQLSD